jgi:beta-lactam-binding protein with PASTA domain/predicted Ser/Thr protein kinase
MRQLDDDAVIDDRYKITAHLGSGGMAEVYCATDLQLGRNVALKILHGRFAEDEQFVERFKREASSAAGLAHQHVVAVYDRGEWDGTSYIAMEYVAGRTLKQIVVESGPLDPQRAVDLTVQILRAARFAHRRGIIHRDFKPQNVIVDDDDRAKVTDFGIARAGASDMTQTGSILGTAQYLSPEQAQGHAVGARSDLYSIGIVLYELLTGKVPFEADSAVTIALKQVSEAPVPPSQINPRVTPELESVVLRALAKEPEDRFADADEFIAALDAAASRIPSARQIAAAEAAAAALPAAAAGGGGGAMAPPPSTPRPQAPPPPPPPPADAGPPTGVRPVAVVSEQRREPVAVPPGARPGARKRWPWLVLGGLVLLGLVVLLVSLLTPKKVAVPNVVGASISVAQQRLTSEGFKVEAVRDTSDKPRNTVFGQDPGAGTTADDGATITIRVSEGPAIVNVPDIVGDGRLQARKTLTDAGFVIEETRAFSDSVAVDRVISQRPDGGSLSESGKAVKIVVSSGPERLPVPDVVGKSQDDARSALDAFKVTVTTKEDDGADPGTVLAQDPAARSRAARGSTVRLTVAIEPKQIDVPDVVGRSQNNATKTLSGRGFEVSSTVEAVDTLAQDGKVLKQSPAPAGGKVNRGSTVTITVGRFDPELNPEPGTPTTTTTTPSTTTTTTTTTP